LGDRRPARRLGVSPARRGLIPRPSTFTLWLRSRRIVDIRGSPVRSLIVLCARCGHKNPDDARFCSSCGVPLAAAGSDDAATLTLSAVEAADTEDELEHYIDGLAPGGGLLVVRHG